MRTEVLGHVTIDRNISEGVSYVGAGGPAVFIEKIFRQLPNCRIGIIAPYGPDLIPYLDGSTLNPKHPTSASTLVYENVSALGRRSQKALNRDEARPIPLSGDIAKTISEADILFFAPLLPNFPAQYLADVEAIAKKDSLKVLLPQGYFRDFDPENNVFPREFLEAREVLSHVDVVIVSEQDHSNMLEIAREWSKDTNLISVVTLGEKGAVGIIDRSEVYVPVNPVSEEDIVDSVGSGDIFSAGFAYFFKQTGKLEESIRFANELARQALFYPADRIKIEVGNYFNSGQVNA